MLKKFSYLTVSIILLGLAQASFAFDLPAPIAMPYGYHWHGNPH